MTIAVACPSCKSKMQAPDKLAGKKVKCPKCGSPILVALPIPNKSGVFLKYAIAGVVIPLIVIIVGGLAVDYLKPRRDQLGNEGQGSTENTGRGSVPPATNDPIAKVKTLAGIDLASIPAGQFYMGSNADDKDAHNDEKPRHKVVISKPFQLGKVKVTVGQFTRFVTATGYKTEGEKAGDKKTWRNPGFDQTDEHPVVWVSWNDAYAFCRWLAKETGANVRLPREAEWEYSCRAKATTKFYFGDSEAILGDYAWYAQNTNKTGTQPCGIKKPNLFGLYDMHGLVLGVVCRWPPDLQRSGGNRSGGANEPRPVPRDPWRLILRWPAVLPGGVPTCL